jgi:quercetin dioxygenase-like cupin family protein
MKLSERVEPFLLSPGKGRTGRPLHVLGDMVTIKVSSEDVGGRYCVVEIQSPPGGGTPMHVHHREYENFYVLEGEFTVHVGGHVHRAAAGSFLFAPREIPHRYENTGQSTGRLLVMAEPGGLDRMFEEFQGAIVAGRPDMDKIGEICRRYEIEFVT